MVLQCSMVKEVSALDSPMGNRAPFSRSPATLWLRDVSIPLDQVPDTLTPFIPPTAPDPEVILIEATASSPEIPKVDLLLHADCNEQEVVCEISHCYFPSGGPSADGVDRDDGDFLTAVLDLEGSGLSTTLVLQALEDVHKDPAAPTAGPDSDPGEGRPGLRESGSLQTKVVFVVFSSEKELSAPLGGDALLHCGFRWREAGPGQEVGQEVALEWRLQHRGRGKRILDLKTSPDSPEHSVNVMRVGSSVDPVLLVADGNASMTLHELKVSDEGTYICTVKVGRFQAQQTVKLHVQKPPRVSLSENMLVSQEFPNKLSCHCQNYYPLDAKMEWFSVSPDGVETSDLSGQIALSSHRQYGDGTVSVSSHLYLDQRSFPPGTNLTCRVTHPALAAPVSTSLVVREPTPAVLGPGDHWVALLPGFLLISVLLVYQLWRV